MDDLRDSGYVPEGWIRTSKNNRVIFKSKPPYRITIQNKKMLTDYQKKGQFLDADAEKMDFRGGLGSRNVVKVADETDGDEHEDQMDVVGEDDDFMEVDSEPSDQRETEEQEKGSVQSGTKRLKLDSTNPVNHGKELDEASKILSQVLSDSSKLELNMDVEKFREELLKTDTAGDFIEALKGNHDLFLYFSVLVKARGLSELINLPKNTTSPLVGWPTNVNANIYHEIIKLANAEAREMLSFLCNTIVPKDEPVKKEHVIRVADIFSTFAHSVSKHQNALAKLKSVVLQTEGLSTAGLDRLAKLKGTECSTTLSRGRHLLVELGEASFRANVKKGRSYTITCDNLNLKQQNMTQSVIHMDAQDTSQLNNIPLDPKHIPNLFETDNFLLSSPQHQDMMRHFSYVVAIRVGNVLGKTVQDASKLVKYLPSSHCHGGSKEEKKPSEIFIPPPDYLNETDNSEFFEFCLKKQSEFLDAVGESVDNKSQFVDDLALIKCTKMIESGVLESELEVEAREDAEGRVHRQVEKFGRWIGFGDALTFKQFHLGAKALAKGNCTAYERLEFLAHFRLALFHAKMNKIYMDFPVMMPKKSMMADEGSLPELVALAGVQGISNEEKKIGAKFEKHDQLLHCVGHLYVANMFKNYIKEEHAAMDDIVDEDSAIKFVLKMLEKYDVELFFNPTKPQPPEEKWDHPASYARDVVTRMILSEVFDAGEEEEDSYLLRCLRLIMMTYFLNRKYKIQDSKYAAYIILDEILEQQASERDRERMNRAVCVNPSGKRRGGLFT